MSTRASATDAYTTPLPMPMNSWDRKRAMSVPQVRLADGVLVLDLVGRSAADDRPGLEHVGALRDGQCEVRVLLDDEHGGSHLLVDRAQALEQVLGDERSETQRGLVEEQQPGTGHEPAGDGEHLL